MIEELLYVPHKCTLFQDNNNLKTKKQPELTENRTVWKSDHQGDKEETFIQTVKRGRGAETCSWAERAHSKVAAGGPSEVADCGAGWAKLQLAEEAAAGAPDDTPGNLEFQLREIKPQNTD